MKLSRAHILLGLILIASFVCLPQLRKADFGYKLEHFFSADNSEFNYYTNYKEKFGNENNFVMLSFEHEKTVFDSLFLNRQHKVDR